MVHVEIETGVLCRNNRWGWMVHFYEMPSFEYDGYWECSGSYDDEPQAREAARKWLDGEYGKRGWKHV